MPTYGFSAFLKLLSLNERPQRREIRNRYRPSSGGYDFHRSLRLLAQRYLIKGHDYRSVFAECSKIVKEAERRSAQEGLARLEKWRAVYPGATFAIPSRTFQSPNDVFQVNFPPDLGIRIDGKLTAIHLWNTANPPLSSRMVYAALAMFEHAYDGERPAVEDLGVLSLKDGKLYRLSDVGDYSTVAERLVQSMEEMMDSIKIDEESINPTADDGDSSISSTA